MSHSTINQPAHTVRRNVVRTGVRTERTAVVRDLPAKAVVRVETGRTAVRHTGPRGRDGSDGGESTPVELISFESITEGQAIRVRPNTGKASPAQADASSTSDVFGFATNSVGADATVEITRDRVTLPNWSALAGTTLLTPGVTYFLSTSTPGGIQTTPPTTAGQVVCVVGEAISTTTLAVQIGIPILL